jgi:cytochrome c oxidase cbb3-type subunit 3
MNNHQNHEQNGDNGKPQIFEGEPVMNHNYDGIHELDHPLPNWWVASFVLTVLFGVPYFIYYTLGSGPNLKAEHAVNMQAIYETREMEKKKAAQFNEAEYLKVVSLDKEQGGARAKEIFNTNCASCHLESGAGDIGPNLTDDYWINIKKVAPENIYTLVFNGVEDKGMPVWSEVLSKEEIYLATSFVLGLNNTFVEGGKEPQGEKIAAP